MDSDGQLTFDDDIVTIRYKQGFQHVIRKDFAAALDHFQRLNGQAPSEKLDKVIPILEFIAPRYAKLDSLETEEKKASFLQSLWKEFDAFYRGQKIDFPEFREQIRGVLLGQVIDLLVKRFQKLDVPDIELLCELAGLFIELRDYDKAEETLVYAGRLSPNDPAVLALRSDAAYFKGDLRQAKGFLREAFFRDPDLACVDRLRSGLVKEIRLLTEKEGHRDRTTAWMPVVATYTNIFDAKRELSKDEVLDLEEQCRSLEERTPRNADAVKPGLIFRYFLLMDHMLASGQMSSGRLVQYESKLKKLDERAYSAYINKVFYDNGENNV